ncbi:endonuclease/exonuclease/phosphatase family protein [Alteromonas sp. A081]|uniref:endonuclease/exonuclease/phosphatase family protein n=1 Tax=Alteromonas sp. A081 TaxID=3410269 RepID=UPI003B9808D5
MSIFVLIVLIIILAVQLNSFLYTFYAVNYFLLFLFIGSRKKFDIVAKIESTKRIFFKGRLVIPNTYCKLLPLLVQLLIVSPLCFSQTTLKVATFNVSMESGNYEALVSNAKKIGTQFTNSAQEPLTGTKVLQHVLSTGENPQVRNIAEIIQRMNPDVLLLNEFDYIEDKAKGVDAFIANYLNVSQHGQPAVDYPYSYIAPVNTGIATPFDLDNNGKAEQIGADAQGFGLYPGHYGMAILSKYPIDVERIRTFQRFKWHHMPHPQKPFMQDGLEETPNARPWYNEKEWAALRLSSKSHWDVPVLVNGETIHILAMHPTPPTFDGAEDRNGKRNHDEIRFMADYLSPDKGAYIYDDNNDKQSLYADANFVVMGDFNAADKGDKYRAGVIEQLIENPLVASDTVPKSLGGAESFDSEYSDRFTASWGARVDYVLPSKGLNVLSSGVFWPSRKSELYRLVENRNASSDHRLVWVSISLP